MTVPTRARVSRGPKVVAARRQGVIRVDYRVLMSPKLCELSDAEFRALVTLWAWVARFGCEGEFPRNWLHGFVYAGRQRRVTPRMLERFVELGLIEEYVYADDATEVLQIADWRDYRPVDLTSAERKRRFRRRLYADDYCGTEGDVMEVDLGDTPETVEAGGRS